MFWRFEGNSTFIFNDKVVQIEIHPSTRRYFSVHQAPRSRVLLEKVIGFQLVRNSPHCMNRRSITAFTSACHLSLSRTSSIQSIPPNCTSWRSSLILPSHLRLGLPSGLYPSGFPTKILSSIRTTWPAHLILLDFITRTILGEEYRSLSSFVTSSLLGPNIHLNTLFSNSLSLPFSLNVSDQVSHSNKQTGKIIVLYILILKFLDSKLEDKRFCTEG